ncbi:hypothetical protein BH23CHL5_BH23CHL5_00610 [soil metagenome]
MELPQPHPWVESFQDRVGFAVQAFALPDDPLPGQKVIAAGLSAEQVGLDGFFIGDHPGYATEPFLHLTAIATQTSVIRLGSIVLCASYRHPAMLARLAAELDHISNGRYVMGLGIGWNKEEFLQLDLDLIPIPDRQAALEEYVDIILGVWGSEPYTFHGSYWRTTGGRVFPPPIQLPRPPLIIAGAGARTTLRQVAQYADACNFGPGRNTGAAGDADEVARKLAILRDHCVEIGRPYDDILRSHFTSWIMLAETEEQALAKRDCYYPDGMNEDQQRTRVIGTPEQVVPYYQALADAGMQYFVCQILDAGDLETIQLLASQVAPNVVRR